MEESDLHTRIIELEYTILSYVDNKEEALSALRNIIAIHDLAVKLLCQAKAASLPR